MTASDSIETVVVLSDIEMGGGGVLDDCPHTAWLAHELLQYNQGEFATRSVRFVFNGDTFDFLKVPLSGAHPRQITEGIALDKLELIAAAHPEFFAALRNLLAHSKAPRRIAFIIGNHDMELFFERVQTEIRGLCGASADQVQFPGLVLKLGDLRIEHGSQGDPLFKISPDSPFVKAKGERILNLPWGSVGLIDAILPYQETLFQLDRIKPKAKLFEILPEAKEFVAANTRSYWTGQFWREKLLGRDPLKKIPWKMLKELWRRLRTVDVKITTGDYFEDLVRDTDGLKVLVIGHEHRRAVLPLGEKALVKLGCLRNEYVIDADKILSRVPMSWLEIDRDRGRTLGWRFQEASPPEPPEDPVLKDIEKLRPVLRAHLAKLREA